MAIGKDVSTLLEAIGYNFSDLSRLDNALTHSSYANESKIRRLNYPSNERLEFLGDAVLEILITEFLYENFKNYAEGMLTKMRQHLVCEKTLSKIALSIDLGDYLHLGRGEEANECRRRPKVLADAFEALVAAIYLDSGKFSVPHSKECILTLFSDEIELCINSHRGDYKTLLQQLVEKDGSAMLEYVVVDENGPDHNKSFTVEARVNNNTVGLGVAGNKKDAEMQAAMHALRLFGVTV